MDKQKSFFIAAVLVLNCLGSCAAQIGHFSSGSFGTGLALGILAGGIRGYPYGGYRGYGYVGYPYGGYGYGGYPYGRYGFGGFPYGRYRFGGYRYHGYPYGGGYFHRHRFGQDEHQAYCCLFNCQPFRKPKCPSECSGDLQRIRVITWFRRRFGCWFVYRQRTFRIPRLSIWIPKVWVWISGIRIWLPKIWVWLSRLRVWLSIWYTWRWLLLNLQTLR